MSRRYINVGVIEYDTASGLPTFAEMRMYEGTKARNADTDEKHRWDGHAWIQGWDSGGSGGGGGIPEPATDGEWIRKKLGAAHTWVASAILPPVTIADKGMSLGVSPTGNWVVANPGFTAAPSGGTAWDAPPFGFFNTRIDRTKAAPIGAGAMDFGVPHKQGDGASGEMSANIGYGNAAKGYASVTFGTYNDVHGVSSIGIGTSNKQGGGGASILLGVALHQNSGSDQIVILGVANKAKETTDPDKNDYALIVGNGLATPNTLQEYEQTTPSNGLMIQRKGTAGVYQKGLVLSPSSDVVDIKAEATGKVLITREYLETPQEIYALVGNNPTMKMEIESAGTAAQMQVIDKATGHDVAQMEYDKATKSFSFTLNDPATGTQKAFFQIKQDGKAYIGGQEISTGGSSGVLTKVEDDTAPKLGGDLNGNGKAISNVESLFCNTQVTARQGFAITGYMGSQPVTPQNKFRLYTVTGKNMVLAGDWRMEKTVSELNSADPFTLVTKEWVKAQPLDRPEVVSPYTATPTAAELATAFKLLPEYVAADAAGKTAFWKGSHDFYVKDDPQTKMLLVKYRGLATSTEASPGNFFFEKLTLAS